MFDSYIVFHSEFGSNHPLDRSYLINPCMDSIALATSLPLGVN